MNDQLANQYAIFRALQASAIFADANVVLGRDYLASKVQQDAIWQSPSPNGKQGVGLIVQIPTIRFPKPNSLQREREYRIGIFEEPNVNWTEGVGTFTSADDWADRVIDFLWNWKLVATASGLTPDERAAVPDTRGAEAGIIGMAVVAVQRQERRQPPRAATPQIAVDGNRNVTLTVADNSTIWFTTDGFSYPAPSTDGSLAGEMKAVQYVAPFAVAAGTTVTAVAWPVTGLGAPIALPSQPAAIIIN